MRKADELVSLIPELKTRALTIDFNDGTVPLEGQYMVPLCKGRKVKSVYQIAELRKVKSTVNPHRYKVTVIRTPEMLPEVQVDYRWNVTVRGEAAIGFHWYKRG